MNDGTTEYKRTDQWAKYVTNSAASINRPRRRRRFVLRHGELHEPGEEEGREQQHVHLQGHHLPYTYTLV